MMAKRKFRNFTIRLSGENEQHIKVRNLLEDLNMDIHKSKNQFIIDAIEFYFNSFDEAELTNSGLEKQQKCREEYVSREEMEKAISDLKAEVYGKVLQLYGGNVLLQNQNMGQIMPQADTGQDNQEEVEPDIEDEVLDAAMKWG